MIIFLILHPRFFPTLTKKARVKFLYTLMYFLRINLVFAQLYILHLHIFELPAMKFTMSVIYEESLET